jgi:hypothetical protein
MNLSKNKQKEEHDQVKADLESSGREVTHQKKILTISKKTDGITITSENSGEGTSSTLKQTSCRPKISIRPSSTQRNRVTHDGDSLLDATLWDIKDEQLMMSDEG